MAQPSDLKKEPPSMAAIGEKLKSAREKKSMDIAQVHTRTRIHSTVIAALEEGRCDKMLTPTYVRSFLAEYAAFLGLNHAEILKEYSALHPEGRHSCPSFNVSKMEPKEPFYLSGVFKLLKFAAAAVVILGVVIFFWSKAANRPRITRPGPRPAAAANRSTRNTTAAAANRARPAAVQNKGTVSRGSSPADTAGSAKARPFTMVLKVNEPVWVEVSNDGLLLFKRFLKKGAAESFRSNDKINIYVAKAEAIEIVVNGRSLGSPGKGLMRNLEVTRNGFRPR